MALAEALKAAPIFGTIPGEAIEITTAAAVTYGLGNAFTRFLILFQTKNFRLPDGDEIGSGFEQFWKETRNKVLKPRKAT